MHLLSALAADANNGRDWFSFANAHAELARLRALRWPMHLLSAHAAGANNGLDCFSLHCTHNRVVANAQAMLASSWDLPLD